jgi:undecaprenyl diphosphate synthase
MNSLSLEEHSIDVKERTYSAEDLTQLDLQRVPHHVAIIMDGNRRWAREKGLAPILGHWKGAETLTRIVRAAADLGIKVLTVYAFSTENWGRCPDEVDDLMQLFHHYLMSQKEAMVEEGVRLDSIGDSSKLPSFVQEVLAETKKATEDRSRIDLVLALNYGGRDDIRRAVVALLKEQQQGALAGKEISESLISSYLDTARWPDPDILIRTSGEKRQSNFLLWQLCYSEFYHTEVLWPDFSSKDLLLAVKEFQKRERRLGRS